MSDDNDYDALVGVEVGLGRFKDMLENIEEAREFGMMPAVFIPESAEVIALMNHMHMDPGPIFIGYSPSEESPAKIQDFIQILDLLAEEIFQEVPVVIISADPLWPELDLPQLTETQILKFEERRSKSKVLLKSRQELSVHDFVFAIDDMNWFDTETTSNMVQKKIDLLSHEGESYAEHHLLGI